MKVTEIPAKPKEQKILRVAAYARVSSDKDAAFHSLEAQQSYYEDYVSKHENWTLAGIYSDNGISGTLVKRPEFQRMMQDCRDGKIDLVVTKSVTRFARNTVVLLESIRELKALGIDCYFEKENMHSISPDGELLLTLLAMYAEEEARSASENVKWKVQKRFEAGKPWVVNMLGYHMVNGEIAVIPEEAEIVRNIFQDYLSGMGKVSIAKKYASLGYTNSKLKRWSNGTIRYILTNRIYVGDLLLQKTYREDYRTKRKVVNTGQKRQYFVENSHEAIIDRKTFDAVQVEIQRRRALNPKAGTGMHSNDDNPFKGIIKCGICGYRYCRKKNHSKLYCTVIWMCYGYAQRGKSYCPSQAIPEDILIEKTKEVLGVDDFTKESFLEVVQEIIVPEHNHLVFVFRDGSRKDVLWTHRSRSLSWTPEMRQAASKRATQNNPNRNRKEKA